MGRSIKKGPYVQEALMKRVLAMNEAGEKKVLKTWSRSSTIFPDFVVTHLQYTMAESMFLYTLQRTW